MPWFISVLLFILLSATVSMTPVSAASLKQTSIVLKSLSDEPWASAGEKTAEILRQKLKENSSLYLVDSQNVDSVLKYYEGDDDPNRTEQEIKDFLLQAKDHYFQLAYPEAEAESKKIISIFQKNPELIFNEGQELVEGWLTLGLVEAAGQQKPKALEAFQEVVKLAPFYPLDSKTFPPSVRELFEEARASVTNNADKGNLVVEGEPKVAEVYLNGVYQGVSPLTVSGLPAGEYALSFKAHHYQTIHQHLLIQLGETTTIRHKLYWTGPKKIKVSEKIASTRKEVEEGIRIAELLKVDKVLFLRVDDKTISARLIDRTYRASHKPIVVAWNGNTDSLEENLDHLARLILAQTELPLWKNPQAHLDPDGIDDPILLGQVRHGISKKAWIGGLSAIGVGGVLAGILAASGGGAATPQTGTVALSFK